MKAVKKELTQIIKKLQSFELLNSFALAGGTSLAILYNHRISDDIDLFTNKLIGINGFEKISLFLKNTFEKNLKYIEIINHENGNQFCFLRFLLKTKSSYIKVELIQNMQYLFTVNNYKSINILDLRDIGILKLKSAAQRFAKKDIYDLDFITNEIPLSDLLFLEDKKNNLYKNKKYKCLFDASQPLRDLEHFSQS